jgi:glycylpeptide N-tetradecanoyltransferase
MVKKDAKAIQALLIGHLKQYAVYPELSSSEIKHFFCPKENIIDTYVVEETVGEKGEKKITDFFSFYTVSCSVLKHETIKEYKGAYTFYYANTKHSVTEIMKAALIQSVASGHDIFFCLNVMQNKQYFEVCMIS